MIGNVDLHVHSSVSDGSCTPEELVRIALDLGLSAIALTDHDTIAGVESAVQAAQNTTLSVIPGVEISTLVGSTEAHILGYFVDCKSTRLLDMLAILRTSRLARAEKMLSALAQLGVRISWEQIGRTLEDQDRQIIGRPHIAHALVQAGYASSLEQAFERYLVQGRPAYVERYKLSPIEAITLIREAGGVPALAHPLHITDLAPKLAKHGLGALEVFYKGYSPGEVSGLLSVARGHGLIPTGGSDFHGRPEPPVGRIFIPPGTVDRLKAAATARIN